jgi:hypothetical protein
MNAGQQLGGVRTARTDAGQLHREHVAAVPGNVDGDGTLADGPLDRPAQCGEKDVFGRYSESHARAVEFLGQNVRQRCGQHGDVIGLRPADGVVIGHLQVCAVHVEKVTALSQKWETTTKTVTAVSIIA